MITSRTVHVFVPLFLVLSFAMVALGCDEKKAVAEADASASTPAAKATAAPASASAPALVATAPAAPAAPEASGAVDAGKVDPKAKDAGHEAHDGGSKKR